MSTLTTEIVTLLDELAFVVGSVTVTTKLWLLELVSNNELEASGVVWLFALIELEIVLGVIANAELEGPVDVVLWPLVIEVGFVDIAELDEAELEPVLLAFVLLELEILNTVVSVVAAGELVEDWLLELDMLRVPEGTVLSVPVCIETVELWLTAPVVDAETDVLEITWLLVVELVCGNAEGLSVAEDTVELGLEPELELDPALEPVVSEELDITVPLVVWALVEKDEEIGGDVLGVAVETDGTTLPDCVMLSVSVVLLAWVLSWVAELLKLVADEEVEDEDEVYVLVELIPVELVEVVLLAWVLSLVPRLLEIVADDEVEDEDEVNMLVELIPIKLVEVVSAELAIKLEGEVIVELVTDAEIEMFEVVWLLEELELLELVEVIPV
jgi:hypothetical protein